MPHALACLLAGEPVDEHAWGAFWDRLNDRASAAEAVALLETLRDHPVDPRTAAAMIASLDARREHPAPRHAVNIVGSGGGPATFNLSTAAAIVAAAIGVPVIKTGSRGYTSRYGSVDLLQLLGIPLAGSHEEIDEQLQHRGIAFAGPFVYPAEIGLLAKRVLPARLAHARGVHQPHRALPGGGGRGRAADRRLRPRVCSRCMRRCRRVAGCGW